MNSRLQCALNEVEHAHRALSSYAAKRARLPHLAKTNLSWAAINRKQADVADAEAAARSMGASDDQITIAQRQAETQ